MHLAGFPVPPVRRVRLQMMETLPYGQRLTTSVADGDSLRYYPAYQLPGLALLEPQPPVAARTRAQAQLLLGGPAPPAQRRWAGVYSQVTGDTLCTDRRSRRACCSSPGQAGAA